jgi:hypothetical protein
MCPRCVAQPRYVSYLVFQKEKADLGLLNVPVILLLFISLSGSFFRLLLRTFVSLARNLDSMMAWFSGVVPL